MPKPARVSAPGKEFGQSEALQAGALDGYWLFVCLLGISAINQLLHMRSYHIVACLEHLLQHLVHPAFACLGLLDLKYGSHNRIHFWIQILHLSTNGQRRHAAHHHRCESVISLTCTIDNLLNQFVHGRRQMHLGVKNCGSPPHGHSS